MLTVGDSALLDAVKGRSTMSTMDVSSNAATITVVMEGGTLSREWRMGVGGRQTVDTVLH